MKTLKILATFLLAISLGYGCTESTSETTETQADTNESEISNEGEEVQEEVHEEEIVEVEQTVDERIAEIKQLYGQIQKSPNQTKDCKSDAVKDVNYDVVETGIEFVNTAKECLLEDDLKYQQVRINGYEWSETCSFYFKEDKCFFAYLSGGAEACGYDYRVYYDEDGEVIRVLLAENDCDGQEVSASVEVTDDNKKKEILDSIASAKKELKEILNI